MTVSRSKKAAAYEKSKSSSLWKKIAPNWELYLFILPVVAYFIIFHYWPMYGIQIAFRDYKGTLGIWGSEWVGLEHFQRFFNSYYIWRLIRNTITISLYQLLVGFPIPIIMALGFNELKSSKLKKFAQTVTYAPHFISLVVLVSMIQTFLSPSVGMVNRLIEAMGGEAVYFMTEAKYFKTIYVFSGVWQNMGWNSIIYMAALAGVDPSLHEAAIMDGATRFDRIWHINIPSILPTITIMLIMNVGGLMNVGFEKVFLMQNSLNMESSDIISTYVYRMGMQQGQYSFSAAVGLFNSVINFILLITVNTITKKIGETSLW